MSGFIVPTGFIIKEYIEDVGISQKELAVRIGVSEKHISNVFNGKCRLTEELALKLEKVIRAVPASYWLNYESKYREFIARKEYATTELNERDLKRWDKKFKFSKVFDGLDWDITKQASEMLSLLGISSFNQFEAAYSNINVDFMEDGGELESIAVWLNLAREEVEIQNKDLSNIQYSKAELYKSLPKFKKISLNKDYESSIKSARKLLNRLGVHLVFCEAIVNSKVRGALTSYKKKPAIFLSGRFKTHDHVWFALMHEIGHLFMHYDPNEPLISMEEELPFKEIPQREKEANMFARDFFICTEDYKKFVEQNSFNQESLEHFAMSQSVLPGIVLSRLQHDGYLEYHKFNFLKNYKN